MNNDYQKNHVEKDNNYLWGTFLNQARLNAYITLCHISDLLEESTVDEDSIATMSVLDFLDSDKDIIKSERVFKLVEKHFPVLKIIYDKQKEKGKDDDAQCRSKKYKEILTRLLQAINFNRNKYCHICSGKKEPNYDVKTLIKHLDNCFDVSVDKIKNRLSLFENDKRDDDPKDEVIHLRRFKGAEKENGKKKSKANPKFHYHFNDNKGQLSEKGLAFLAALFLSKKDAHEFLKKQHGFKRSETPAARATLESFYCYRITIPKPVISSDVDKNGLALDTLNELKKCPKESFELLSKERQKEFRVIDSEDTEEDGNEILMRRYSDRFDYLSLRYCDENEVFDKIRFHIDLGRYYFKFYPKQTIDGDMRQRALDKRLKTFGRIKEVKDKVDLEWGDLIKAPGEKHGEQSDPYKTKTTPHYHLVDNQIGFVLGDRDLPDIKQPEGKISLKEPDAWLSIYELPGMIFHGLSNSRGFKRTEELIEQHITRQKEICKQVSETGVIPENAGKFLPKALRDAIAGKAKQSDYAKKKLQRMLDDTSHRIKALKATRQRMADPGNKPGKKKFFDLRAGKLADFLARDIMALQKFDPNKEGKDKLTSVNFQVLQATLAYYGAKKDTIENIFRTSGLLGGDNPHPFLNQIKPTRHNSIADFYEAYLNIKEKYLEGCQKDGNLDSYQFLRPSRQRYAKTARDLKQIAGRLFKQPVNIPKGFFKEQIEEIVCNKVPSPEGREMNTAYMIQGWFKKTQGNQQPFYGYAKTYPVVSKAKEYAKKRTNQKIAETLRSLSPEMSYKDLKMSIEENIPENGRYDPENLRDNLLKGCKDLKKNERALKRFRVQDIIMFMMVEKTLKDQLSIEGKFLQLEAITPTPEKKDKPFNKPILCHTDIKIPFNTNPNHHDASYVGFIQEQYKDLYATQGKKIILKYKITSENTKLKDIGKYRRYLYDRRTPGLLIWQYPPNAQSDVEIKYSEIERQIMAYDQNRLKIAEQLYLLEKLVIDCFVPKHELGDSHISFNAVAEKLQTELIGFEEKGNVLLKIRNALGHNQFPVFMGVIENAAGDTIAEKMFSITESYVQQATKQIEDGDRDKDIANV